MMKTLLLFVAVAYTAAFAPAAPAQAVARAAVRSDAAVMAAKKKKGVNPALFSTGIAPKKVVRGGGRKDLKAGTGNLRANDGSWKGLTPWRDGQKAANNKISGWQQISGMTGSKQGRDSGAGIFFLGGGRSRK